MRMTVDLAAQRETYRLSVDLRDAQDSPRDAVLQVLRRQAVHGEKVVGAVSD